MGLSIRSMRGKFYPLFACDNCGKPISSLSSAIVVFSHPIGKTTASARGIYHKGACDPRNSGNRVPDAKYWHPLGHCLAWALCNHDFGEIITTGQKTQLLIDVPPPIGFGW